MMHLGLPTLDCAMPWDHSVRMTTSCKHPNSDNVSGFCDRPAEFFADVSADGGDSRTPVCADCAAFDMPRCGYAVTRISESE
jgi:hypothetical protein